ncbi:hypothetical protein ABEW34_30480 [Paenibacillus algorifonticola]|uniref:hypothetical protein n=1 Tax=Paenibacillus algorifonticola TaxID=684063 RepID=UPI003D2C728B
MDKAFSFHLDICIKYYIISISKFSKRTSKALLEDLDAYKHIKVDRNIERVRQRYIQLTKPELIEMIIKMEQYISHQNKQWLKNEFEKFQ